jgi:catechol 2,3-dioxygenase-like lactoylglutathione lyase family enzyme
MQLGHVIIYVADVEKTVAFYERAFGLKRRFVHESGAYAELETGATALGFVSESELSATGHHFRPNKQDDSPAGAEIVFVVEDVSGAFEHAVAAGALPYAKPEEKPWGQTVSYVRDNNGFLVELCSKIS